MRNGTIIRRTLCLAGIVVVTLLIMNAPAFLESMFTYYKRINPIQDISRSDWFSSFNRIHMIASILIGLIGIVFYTIEEWVKYNGSHFRFTLNAIIYGIIILASIIITIYLYPFETDKYFRVFISTIVPLIIQSCVFLIKPIAPINYQGLFRK